MPKINKTTPSPLTTRLAILGMTAVGSLAGAADTTGAIDLASAQTNVVAMVGVGVAITTALTIYGLSKRGANRL